MDPLSCSGPTREIKPCELEDCPLSGVGSNGCSSPVEGCSSDLFPTHVKVLGYPCKYHFVTPCATWHDARMICKNNFFGKLFEPANKEEYAAVLNAAEAEANTKLGGCRWWLGFHNWNYEHQNGRRKETFFSSLLTTPATSPYYQEPVPRPEAPTSEFITVDDGSDNNENCVHTKRGNWNAWNDLNCDDERLNFICQSCPAECTCQHDGVLYPCGALIRADAQSCSHLMCSAQGRVISKQQFWDYCTGAEAP